MKRCKRIVIHGGMMLLCSLYYNMVSAQTPFYIDSVIRETPKALYVNSSSIRFRIKFSNIVQITDNSNAFEIVRQNAMGLHISLASGEASISPTKDSTLYFVEFTAGVSDGFVSLSLNKPEIITGTGTNTGSFMGFRSSTYREGYIIDSNPPSVILSAPKTIVRNGDVIPITATFTENTLLKKNPSISISGATTIPLTTLLPTANPNIFTYNWIVPNTNGTAMVSITASDTTGNANAVATGSTIFVIDNTPPTVVHTLRTNNTTSDKRATSDDNVVLQMVFSENLASAPSVLFRSGGALVNNIINVVGTGSVWTATYRVNNLDADGVVFYSISFQDLAGNMVTRNEISSVHVDKTAPAVSITRLGVDSITNASNVLFSISYSESVIGIQTNRFTVALGTINSITEVGSSKTQWTLAVGSIGTSGKVEVRFNAPQSITDSAGNIFTANSIITNEWYRIDKDAPTVRLSSPKNTVKYRDTILITATFTENTLLKKNPKISISGASTVTITSLLPTVNPKIFTYSWVVPNSNGTAMVSIIASDTAGNGNTNPTGDAIFTIDNTLPIVVSHALTTNNAISRRRAKLGETVTLEMVFSERLIASPTVSLRSGGALVNNPVTVAKRNNSDSLWTAIYQVNSLDIDGAISYNISFQDRVGNIGTLNVTTSSTIIDKTIPTVSITKVSTDSITNNSNVEFYIQYNEYVIGVGTTNFNTPSVGAVGSITEVNPNNKTRWKLTIGSINTSGKVEVRFNATQNITDSAGNNFTTSSITTNEWYRIDKDAPTVRLSAPKNTVKYRDTILITATFTENTLLKKNPKISVSGASTVAITTLLPTVNPKIFTYSWVVPNSNGTASVSIIASDTAGNGNTNPTGDAIFTIDNTLPTVVSHVLTTNNSTSGKRAKLYDSVYLEIFFSEGLITSPTVLLRSGGALVNNPVIVRRNGSDLLWTAIYQVNSLDIDGAISYNIAFQDRARNIGTLNVTTSSTIIDKTIPTVSITKVSTDSITNNSTVEFYIQYNEHVIGVGTTNFNTPSVGAVGSITEVTPNNKTRWKLTISSINTSGKVELRFITTPNITDSAGNIFTANGITTNEWYRIDKTNPTMAVAHSVIGKSITFSFQQSEHGTIYYTSDPSYSPVNNIYNSGVMKDSIAIGLSGTATRTLEKEAGGEYDFYFQPVDVLKNTGSVTNSLRIKTGSTSIVTEPYPLKAVQPFNGTIRYDSFDILISERIPNDFRTGNDLTLRLGLPSGFVYNTTSMSTLATKGRASTDISQISLAYEQNGTVLRILYTTTGSSSIDTIRIQKIKIANNNRFNIVDTDTLMKRIGGTGYMYLANEEDNRTFAILKVDSITQFDILENTRSSTDSVYSGADPGDLKVGYLQRKSAGREKDSIFYRENYAFILTSNRRSNSDNIVIRKLQKNGTFTEKKIISRDSISRTPSLFDTLSFLNFFNLTDDSIGIHTFEVLLERNKNEGTPKEVSISYMGIQLDPERRDFQKNEQKTVHVTIKKPSTYNGTFVHPAGNNPDIERNGDTTLTLNIPKITQTPRTIPIQYQLTQQKLGTLTPVSFIYDTFHIRIRDTVQSFSKKDTFCFRNDSYILPIKSKYIPKGSLTDTFLRIFTIGNAKINNIHGSDTILAFITSQGKYKFSPKNLKKYYQNDTDVLFKFFRIQKNGTKTDTIQITSDEYRIHELPTIRVTGILQDNCIYDQRTNITYSLNGISQNSIHKQYTLQKQGTNGWNDILYKDSLSFLNPRQNNTTYSIINNSDTFSIIYTSLPKPAITKNNCVNTDTFTYRVWKRPSKPGIENSYQYYTDSTQLKVLYADERKYDRIYSVADSLPTFYKWYKDTMKNSVSNNFSIITDSIKLKGPGTTHIYLSKIQFREPLFNGCESFKSSAQIDVFRRASRPYLLIDNIPQINSDNTAKNVTLTYCKDTIPHLSFTVGGDTSLFNTKNRYFNWYQKIKINNKKTIETRVINKSASKTNSVANGSTVTNQDLGINNITRNFQNDTLEYLVTQKNTVIPNQYPGTESDSTKITIILLGNPPQLSVDTFSYCASDTLKTITIQENRVPNSQIKWYWDANVYEQDSIISDTLKSKIPFNTTSSDQIYNSLRVEQTIRIGSKSCKSSPYSVIINRFAKPITPILDEKEYGSCYINNKSIVIQNLPTSNNIYNSKLHIIYNRRDSLLNSNIMMPEDSFQASKSGIYKIYTMSKIHKGFPGCLSDTASFTIYEPDSLKIKYRNVTDSSETIVEKNLQICPENEYSFNAYYPYYSAGDEVKTKLSQSGFTSSQGDIGFIVTGGNREYKANKIKTNEFTGTTYDTITYKLERFSCTVKKSILISIPPRPKIKLTAYKYLNNRTTPPTPIPLGQFCFDSINATQTKINFKMDFENRTEFNDIGIDSAQFHDGKTTTSADNQRIVRKYKNFQIDTAKKIITDPNAFYLEPVYYKDVARYTAEYKIVTATGCRTIEYANRELNNPENISFSTSKSPTPKFTILQQPTKNGEVTIKIPQGSSGEFGIGTTEIDSILLKIQNKNIIKRKIFNSNIATDIEYTVKDTSKQIITLTMVSIGNCSSTGTITIPVLSVVTVTPAIPYTENFDTQKTLWLVDKTILFGITRTNDPLSNYKFIVDPNDDNYKKTIRENSWKIGTISNTNNNTKGFVTTNAKYTSSSGAGDPIENTYYTNENSWVFSPAFNISQINRPMVSFMYYQNFQANTEGVVFQYSTNNGKNWYNVGTYKSGINWYNSKTVTNNPGEINATIGNTFNTIGWTNDNNKNSKEWMYAAHKLDEIPIDKRNSVRFRFAIASDANEKNSAYPGFGFDDFFLGERKGMSILEKFTYFQNNKSIDDTITHILSNPILNNQDIIEVAYHTDVKQDTSTRIDPLFATNITDPGARINFYGVVKVPTSIINGSLDSTSYTPKASGNIPWSEIDIQKTQLTTPHFSISLNNLTTSSNDSLKLSITIQSHNSLIPISDTRIYILAIQSETTINGIRYKNVVRKIIPNALGITINKAQSVYKQGWKIDPFLITQPENLQIVAFIQNIKTKEIYNADIINTPKSPIPIPILAQIQKKNQKNINIYPNPANTELTIDIKNNSPKEIKWTLESITGQSILQGTYTNSKNPSKINITNTPNGTYILNIYHLNTIIHTEQIIINHTK